MDDGALDYFRQCITDEVNQETDVEDSDEEKEEGTQLEVRPYGRHNSTSTVKVRHTMSRPNHEATIEVIANVLHEFICNGDRFMKGDVNLKCFNDPIFTAPTLYYSDSEDEEDEEIIVEEKDEHALYAELASMHINANKENSSMQRCPAEWNKNPKARSGMCEIDLDCSRPNRGGGNTLPLPPVAIPTPATIREYLKNMFVTAQCSEECNIICLIYINRLLDECCRGGGLNAYNWKATTMTALLLASKVWDDLSMVNEDFSIFMPYSLDQINDWERRFLSMLKYNVRVGASEYARVYFELRKQAQRAGLEALPDKELDLVQAAKLEALTSTMEKRTKQMYYDTAPLPGNVSPQPSGPIHPVHQSLILEHGLRRTNSDAGKRKPFCRYVID